MLDMAKKLILPASLKYTKFLTDLISSKKDIGLQHAVESKLAQNLSITVNSLYDAIEALDNKIIRVKEIDGVEAVAKYYRNEVFVAMNELRAIADELEVIVAEEYWPLPTYSKLLFDI
jgi:glutamine synthetase